MTRNTVDTGVSQATLMAVQACDGAVWRPRQGEGGRASQQSISWPAVVLP